MKKTLLTFLFFSLIYFAAKAQTPRSVSGTVVDSAGITQPAISVKLTVDTTHISVSTDMNGKFSFPQVTAEKFKLTFTGIGYDTLSRSFDYKQDSGPIELPNTQLKSSIKQLSVVTITAPITPIIIKQDTVEYNADAYKVRDGSVAEDVLKKLPGVDVDKDGNIVAHGKPVTKVRVNGKDFFSGDPKNATQNLPADVIQSIQVIDDYGDQANLTGIKTGEPAKILNIVIKKNKNTGSFGRGNIGGGTDKRYNNRITFNRWRDKEMTSVLGNLNNTNSSSDGDNIERSGQIRFSDEWKKVKIDGRYAINNNETNVVSTSLREERYAAGTINRVNQSNNGNSRTGHSTDFNIEYRPDTLNFFKFSPNFNINMANNNNRLDFRNTRNDTTDVGLQRNTGDSRSPNFGANLLFNHRFKKKGRNFSINLNFNSSDNRNTALDLYNAQNQETSLRDTIFQQINTAGSTDRFGTHISYTEPLGKTTFLEANYDYSYTNNKNDRFNYRIDPYTNTLTYVDSLSTAYNYQFINNRFGLNLRSIKTKYNFTLGMGIQPTVLQGEFQGTNTKRTTVNFIPNANFIYKFATSKTLTFNYSGSNQQPSFNQLQPKPDLSNPQNRIYGNPLLKPEFQNRFNLGYNQFDIATGNSMFAGMSFSSTSNNIVSNSRALRADSGSRLIRETRYQNADGNYAINGNYAFTKPFTEKGAKNKFSVTLNGNTGFNNNVSFIEGNRNIAKNLSLSQGLKFRADLDSIMDTEISGSYTTNSTKNSLTGTGGGVSDRRVNTWRMGLDGRNYFFKGFILGYNFSKTIYSGFNGNTPNPVILSTYLEYQFMKQNLASLRIQGFDLLNQNTGVYYSLEDNITVDTRTNKLGRYFMLTFSYRFRKFAGGTGRREGERGERREGGEGRGGNRGGGGGGGGRGGGRG